MMMVGVASRFLQWGDPDEMRREAGAFAVSHEA
jgi:hypothetical protein